MIRLVAGPHAGQKHVKLLRSSFGTDLFCGDFSQVLIGQRMDLNVRVLTERYAELGQVGILAYWRGDVQVARPKALACYRAIQGA